MRRITSYLLGLLLVSACNSIFEFPVDGGIDPSIVNVNLTLKVVPEMQPNIPGQSKGAGEYDTRWIIEVFRDEIKDEPVARQVLVCDKKADGHHSVSTSLQLHAARYHIIAWMDYVDDGSTEDKYYIINSLSSVSIPEAGDYIGNEEHKDNYMARDILDLRGFRDRWNETTAHTVTLSRRMAKIEFITTDMDKFLEAHSEQQKAENQTDMDISKFRVKVEYAGYFPCSFNLYTDEPNDARTGMSFGCNMTPLSEKETHLGSDYVFVHGEQSAIKVNLTLYDSEGRLINQIGGIDVPIARGKLTVIRDEFLTRDDFPGIGIDPGFDGDTDIVIPDLR